MTDVELVLQVAEDMEIDEPPPAESAFTHWVQSVAEQQGRKLALTIRLVGLAESQHLNHQYRSIDKPTNVLSFPFEAPPGFPDTEPFIGDLAICLPVILREAREQRKPVEHHWAHMAIHGTLHLLGYDHESDPEAEQMEALETRLLALHSIPDPYRTPGEQGLQ